MINSSSTTEPEWEAIEILRERKHHYLIKWDGIDPDTNKPWEPTWQPKGNASDALIEDWLQKSKQNRRKSRGSMRNTITTSRSNSARYESSTPAESSRKKRKIINTSHQTQTISPSTHNRVISPSPDGRNSASSLKSLPSPSQFLTQPLAQSQSIPYLNSSKMPKLVVVPKTQSDDYSSNKKGKRKSPAVLAQYQSDDDGPIRKNKRKSRVVASDTQSSEDKPNHETRKSSTKKEIKKSHFVSVAINTSQIQIDPQIPNKTSLNAGNPNRIKSASHRSSNNSRTPSFSHKSILPLNHNAVVNQVVMDTVTLIEDDLEEQEQKREKEQVETSANQKDKVAKEKEKGAKKKEKEQKEKEKSAKEKEKENEEKEKAAQEKDQKEKEQGRQEEEVLPSQFFDDLSVHLTSEVNDEYAQLSLATMPNTQILDLGQGSNSLEPIHRNRNRSSDSPSSEKTEQENAKKIILVPEDDDESSKTLETYEPDKETADLIASLNDHDDPNHKSRILEYLNSTSVDPSDRKIITEYIRDPLSYLADPNNEIEPLRSQFSLGNNMAFELKRDERGSICLWFHFTDPNHPTYRVDWDNLLVRQELASMIFRYAQTSSSTSKSPTAHKHPLTVARRSQTQMSNKCSSSIISENEAGFDSSQEGALEGRGKCGSPSRQDTVKKVENENKTPLPQTGIPSVQNEPLVNPPPRDDYSSISENSEPDLSSLNHAQMRIKELEMAIEALQKILSGALDINADFDERHGALIESYETKLKNERQVLMELKVEKSRQAIELTDQRASIIKFEDELKKMQTQVDSYEAQLKNERESVSKLKAENLEKSVQLTGQSASMMKLEDELNLMKNKLKSYESMLKESKHPAKEVYHKFIDKHEKEATSLKRHLRLAESTIARLERMTKKDHELMQSFSNQNFKILDENRQLKATIVKQRLEFKKLQMDFNDLSEADEIHKIRVNELEAYLQQLQQVSQLSDQEDENEISDGQKAGQLEDCVKQTEEIRKNPVHELVPDAPKQYVISDDIQTAHDDHDQSEFMKIDPMSAVIEVNAIPSLSQPTSVLPHEKTHMMGISIQEESLLKKDGPSNEEKLKENNDSQSWISYQPISQLDRPSLGEDYDETNNRALDFLQNNIHDIEEESIDGFDSSINLTQLGMNTSVKVGDKMSFNSNQQGKSINRSTSSALESPKNRIGHLFESSDSNQGRNSCPPNGQTTFKSLRSSIQFSSPACLPKIDTYVTDTSNNSVGHINVNNSIGTIADTNTLLGDVTQSFAHSQ